MPCHGARKHRPDPGLAAWRGHHKSVQVVGSFDTVTFIYHHLPSMWPHVLPLTITYMNLLSFTPQEMSPSDPNVGKHRHNTKAYKDHKLQSMLGDLPWEIAVRFWPNILTQGWPQWKQRVTAWSQNDLDLQVLPHQRLHAWILRRRDLASLWKWAKGTPMASMGPYKST